MKTRTLAILLVLATAAPAALALPDVGAWAIQDTPDFPGCEYYLRDVAFASPDVGAAIGDCLTVLLTTDGGDSWTRIAQHGSVGDLRGVDAAGDSIVAVGRHPFNRPLSYTSLDGGATWTFKSFCVSNAVPIDGAEADFTCYEGWLQDVAVHPDGSFHAVGAVHNGHGFFALSRTGASSWMTYPWVERGLHAIDFAPDGLRGIAVGVDGFTYRTADGGRNWARGGDVPVASLRQVGADMLDVTVVSDTEAWAVGELGLVARTLDGGATWAPIDVGAATSLHSIHVSDEGDVRIGGDYGLILRGIAGAVWVVEPTAWPPGSVRGIDFAAPGHGFGVADGEVIRYSSLAAAGLPATP